MKVTKDYLQDKLKEDCQKLIGRALLAIYRNQTPDEQSSSDTKYLNGIGFSGADAKLGTVCVRYYLQHGNLADWMLKVWSRPTKTGYPKICKYATQLNKIANHGTNTRVIGSRI